MPGHRTFFWPGPARLRFELHVLSLYYIYVVVCCGGCILVFATSVCGVLLFLHHPGSFLTPPPPNLQTQLNSHNSTHTIRLTQLNCSTYTTIHNSAHATRLRQLNPRNSTCPTHAAQLTQLILHTLTQLNSHNILTELLPAAASGASLYSQNSCLSPWLPCCWVQGQKQSIDPAGI